MIEEKDKTELCLENEAVYDDEGNFTAYSTEISTLEEHKSYCASKTFGHSEYEEGVDDPDLKEERDADVGDIFGQFNKTPPSDPFVKSQTILPDGQIFSSDMDEVENEMYAKAQYQVIKINKLISEKNFVKLSRGDTPSLEAILRFVKPFIKQDMVMKACWRQLAKKCPNIDAFEEF